ncbi:amidoligase family protein [Cesiribacter andamanensis]|uniref:amidoligase family protein n=1 Tax=Cesiribacter andamanensis TaxID=649507 RepID=UPI001F3E2085|nr:amidoligase family protein [Cesiribacter andamanensis]
MYTSQGKERTVGFELEYGNVPLDKVATLIQQLFGGTIRWENRFSALVEDTRLGTFTLMFDARLLHEKTYQKPLKKLNIDISTIQLGDSNLEIEVENVLASMASMLVPYEIGTPPVPITRLHELEALREALFKNNAKGTKAFPTNAFATHINPEMPDHEPGTLLRYLQAFQLLYPWMLRSMEIDLARRISPYIDPFPTEYTHKLLQPGYQPSLDQLIDDYHQDNPDRNRPLDLYPLFAWLRREKVATFEDIGKVKPRPTLHFRLPNSQMEEADWSLEKVWNSWVKVENLAADPQKLASLSQEYLRMRKNVVLGFKQKWADHTEKWV